MRRLTILFAAAAVSLSAPAMGEEWHFVGTRLTKPDRLFYFVDMASVSRTGAELVTFDWSVYAETLSAGLPETSRWTLYHEQVDCRANTSTNLSARSYNPDGSSFEKDQHMRPRGWNDTYPITPAQPAALFADLLCGRKQIQTLPLKTIPIPQAVVELIKQLP